MTGALFWLKLDAMEIGVYLDVNNERRLTIRGETSVANMKRVLLAIESVVMASESDEDVVERLDETGALYAKTLEERGRTEQKAAPEVVP